MNPLDRWDRIVVRGCLGILGFALILSLAGGWREHFVRPFSSAHHTLIIGMIQGLVLGSALTLLVHRLMCWVAGQATFWGGCAHNEVMVIELYPIRKRQRLFSQMAGRVIIRCERQGKLRCRCGKIFLDTVNEDQEEGDDWRG